MNKLEVTPGDCRTWRPPSRQSLWQALDLSRQVLGCLEANASNPHPQHAEAALAEARLLVGMLEQISH